MLIILYSIDISDLCIQIYILQFTSYIGLFADHLADLLRHTRKHMLCVKGGVVEGGVRKMFRGSLYKSLAKKGVGGGNEGGTDLTMF